MLQGTAKQLVQAIVTARRQHQLPEAVLQLMGRVRDTRLTYLSRSRLVLLASLCVDNERKSLPGLIIEAGCALGGSAVLMAGAKRKARALRVYDVFGMIPPPSEKDGPDVQERYQEIRAGSSAGIEGDTYYGYLDDLYDRVIQTFATLGYPVGDHNVTCIKGLLQDSLEVGEPVSLAHIDVDWYDSVLTCLQRIEPFLVPGGAIVVDDYEDWSGCRSAVDEYFREKRGSRYQFDRSAGSLLIRKRH